MKLHARDGPVACAVRGARENWRRAAVAAGGRCSGGGGEDLTRAARGVRAAATCATAPDARDIDRVAQRPSDATVVSRLFWRCAPRQDHARLRTATTAIAALYAPKTSARAAAHVSAERRRATLAPPS